MPIRISAESGGDGRQCRPQVRSHADRPDLYDADYQPKAAYGRAERAGCVPSRAAIAVADRLFG
ncbi:MAG TPA: hypothetical protein VF942_17375, partial [Acidimicrobiales bacterium]